MNQENGKIVVAIPAMDEAEWLPGCLESLAKQLVTDFQVVVCVNQPDAWWQNPGKVDVCKNNARTLIELHARKDDFPFRLHILDRSSPGQGWVDDKGGAGRARKVAMDKGLTLCDAEGIIVSADADTQYPPGYLQAIKQRFRECPQGGAIASPYYHPLTGDDPVNEGMLRYELFMRFHLLNLIRIDSPYAFTAIGSALAIRAREYERVGGLPPKPFGEDFYLLQKVAKRSKVLIHLPATVCPAARISHRVAFGTGPAIGDYLAGEHSRYHIIHPELYEPIRSLYQMLPLLYEQNARTPADHYLKATFGASSIWDPIRSNCKTLATFVKACHQKVDALKIWQMVRSSAAADDVNNALTANLETFLPRWVEKLQGQQPSFTQLVALRDDLYAEEIKMRSAYDHKI